MIARVVLEEDDFNLVELVPETGALELAYFDGDGVKTVVLVLQKGLVDWIKKEIVLSP